MNRTVLLVVSAGVLATVALVAGRDSHAQVPRAVAPAAPAYAPPPPPTVVQVPVVVAPPPLPVVASGGSQALQLTAALSSAHVPPGTSELFVKLDLAAAASEAPTRQPVNLAVAVDRSGSMAGTKMQQAIDATVALIDRLRPGDRLAIVAFDDGMRVFSSTRVTHDSKHGAREFVRGLSAGGGTNIGGALEEAWAQLQPFAKEYKVSRAVLISDGEPSTGVTAPDALARLAREARGRRLSTSAFGIGLGFNASLMRDLATGGGGSTAFIENAADLGPVFAAELRDASSLLAREVKVRVTPAPGVRVLEVPGHTFDREGADAVVSLYDFAPRQTAQLMVKLQVTAPSDGSVALGHASVSFVDVKRSSPMVSRAELRTSVGTLAQVQATRNEAVVEQVKAVEISTRVELAKEAYTRGDTRTAFDLMAATRRLFGSSSVDALAGNSEVLEGSWQQGGEAAARANMNLTKKTMKNFGQNNAY